MQYLALLKPEILLTSLDVHFTLSKQLGGLLYTGVCVGFKNLLWCPNYLFFFFFLPLFLPRKISWFNWRNKASLNYFGHPLLCKTAQFQLFSSVNVMLLLSFERSEANTNDSARRFYLHLLEFNKFALTAERERALTGQDSFTWPEAPTGISLAQIKGMFTVRILGIKYVRFNIFIYVYKQCSK